MPKKIDQFRLINRDMEKSLGSVGDICKMWFVWRSHWWTIDGYSDEWVPRGTAYSGPQTRLCGQNQSIYTHNTDYDSTKCELKHCHFTTNLWWISPGTAELHIACPRKGSLVHHTLIHLSKLHHPWRKLISRQPRANCAPTKQNEPLIKHNQLFKAPTR